MSENNQPFLQTLEQKIRQQIRVSPEDAVWMYHNAPGSWLKTQADFIKGSRFGKEVFYNRNIHFEPTNKCIYSCKFCAFYRPPLATAEQGAWEYSFDDIKKILNKYPVGSLTEIHITGGVHKDRGVEYGEELLSFLKSLRPELHIKAFTAVELAFFARKSGITLEETLRRLMDKGLASLPGGGAEIFNPEVRKKIAGGKAPAHQWLEIHELAHNMGLKSNATMLYGHVENFEHRVEHLTELRDLQDKTSGFMAFIPLRYRNENNALSELPEVSEEEDLRNFAVSRIFLDNIPHLKAYWVMLGMETALRSLDWGVDDLDGTIDDSTKIYSMAGGEANPKISSLQLKELIQSVGKTPQERNSLYEVLEGKFF